MFCRLRAHLRPPGIAFLVLPTRCITSRFLGADSFSQLLYHCGLSEDLEMIEKRTSPKLSFYTLQISKETGKPLSESEGKDSPLTWERVMHSALKSMPTKLRSTFDVINLNDVTAADFSISLSLK